MATSRLRILLPAAAMLTVQPLFAEMSPPDTWGHSCYVYRDVNRNGIFDIGDRPYGDLPLEVTHPDGAVSLLTSNIGGFANFEVAMGNRETADVHEPGDYRIRAVLPDGWMSTSDKDEQVLTFVARPNAGGGLVPAETCAPIGVAPRLTVRGQFHPPDGSGYGDITVTASGPGERPAEVRVTAQGGFEFAAGPGDWSILFEDRRGGREYARRVTLDHAAVIVADIRLGADPAPLAGPGLEEIDFDRLVISDGLFEIPSGYGGLDWRNWVAVHNRLYQGAGYVNATISSEYVAYNSSGVPATVSSDRPFDFVGVYMGVAWPRGEEDDVIVRAWRGEEVLHEDRLRLTRFGPIYFDAGYAGVTRVEFSSGNYERIVIDNFRLRRSR